MPARAGRLNPEDARLRPFVAKLWNYLHLNQELKKSDAILVLGSHDRTVAERGAQLWLEGWAPLLILSGGLGEITRRIWNEPEADQFAKIAIRMGVPRERIIIENRSTNTGENIAFTRRLLERMGIDPGSFIVVQKPYMERRAFATFQKLWPEKNVIVTSPQLSLDEYLNLPGPLSAEQTIAIMVGDLQRIRVYAERGFQIAQEIPADVWQAYETLVAAGYDQHLVRQDP